MADFPKDPKNEVEQGNKTGLSKEEISELISQQMSSTIKRINRYSLSSMFLSILAIVGFMITVQQIYSGIFEKEVDREKEICREKIESIDREHAREIRDFEAKYQFVLSQNQEYNAAVKYLKPEADYQPEEKINQVESVPPATDKKGMIETDQDKVAFYKPEPYSNVSIVFKYEIAIKKVNPERYYYLAFNIDNLYWPTVKIDDPVSGKVLSGFTEEINLPKNGIFRLVVLAADSNTDSRIIDWLNKGASSEEYQGLWLGEYNLGSIPVIIKE